MEWGSYEWVQILQGVGAPTEATQSYLLAGLKTTTRALYLAEYRIFEAFLEGAPQSILQLYIILSSCSIQDFQWLTLVSSFMAFTYASSEIYLKCPTKVNDWPFPNVRFPY